MATVPWTVFVIEDDDSVRRALVRLIRSLGWQADGFRSAEDFQESGPRATPYCLVLDICLPGMSGIQLHDSLTCTGKAIPVIFITGQTAAFLGASGLCSETVAVLEKPFSDATLLQAIERLTGNVRESPGSP